MNYSGFMRLTISEFFNKVAPTREKLYCSFVTMIFKQCVNKIIEACIKQNRKFLTNELRG